MVSATETERPWLVTLATVGVPVTAERVPIVASPGPATVASTVSLVTKVGEVRLLLRVTTAPPAGAPAVVPTAAIEESALAEVTRNAVPVVPTPAAAISAASLATTKLLAAEATGAAPHVIVSVKAAVELPVIVMV